MLNAHWDQSNLTWSHSIQVCIQPLRRVEGWDTPHPCIHHCGIQLHHILNGKWLFTNPLCLKSWLLLCNSQICLLFQILALFHFSLGQQLNLYWVHKVLWFISPVFPEIWPHIWKKSEHVVFLPCFIRSECWLHCSPLSLVSSLLMTYGEMSGTSCLYRCRSE